MHLSERPGQKFYRQNSKAWDDIRDLLRKSVRRGSLEMWLGEIPHMESVCSV